MAGLCDVAAFQARLAPQYLQQRGHDDETSALPWSATVGPAGVTADLVIHVKQAMNVAWPRADVKAESKRWKIISDRKIVAD